MNKEEVGEHDDVFTMLGLKKKPAGVGEQILRGFGVIVYRPLADGELPTPES